jgi:hypothetical protein
MPFSLPVLAHGSGSRFWLTFTPTTLNDVLEPVQRNGLTVNPLSGTSR